jgi:hypothetical protein
MNNVPDKKWNWSSIKNILTKTLGGIKILIILFTVVLIYYFFITAKDTVIMPFSYINYSQKDYYLEKGGVEQLLVERINFVLEGYRNLHRFEPVASMQIQTYQTPSENFSVICKRENYLSMCLPTPELFSGVELKLGTFDLPLVNLSLIAKKLFRTGKVLGGSLFETDSLFILTAYLRDYSSGDFVSHQVQQLKSNHIVDKKDCLLAAVDQLACKMAMSFTSEEIESTWSATLKMIPILDRYALIRDFQKLNPDESLRLLDDITNYMTRLADQSKDPSIIFSSGKIFYDTYLTKYKMLGNSDKKLIQEAKKYFSYSLNIAPHYFPAALGLGLVNMELNDWQEAESALKYALSLKPKEQAVLNGIGFLYFERKDLKDRELTRKKNLYLADKYFRISFKNSKQSQQLAGNHPSNFYHIWLGNVAWQLAKLENWDLDHLNRAVDYYKTAVDLLSEPYKAWELDNKIAYARYRQVKVNIETLSKSKAEDYIDDGLSHVERALEKLKPLNSYDNLYSKAMYLSTKAELLLQRGDKNDLQEIIRLLEEAKMFVPSATPEIFRDLAVAYEMNGKRDVARTYWQIIFDKDSLNSEWVKEGFRFIGNDSNLVKNYMKNVRDPNYDYNKLSRDIFTGIEFDTRNVFHRYYRGLCLSQKIINQQAIYNAYEIQSAIAEFMAADQLSTFHSGAKFQVAKLNLLLERWDVADSLFHIVLSKEPKNFECLFHLGNLYYLDGNFQKAQYYFYNAYNIFPYLQINEQQKQEGKYMPICYRLGICFHEDNQPKFGYFYLRKVLENDNLGSISKENIFLRLSMCCAEIEDREKAAQYLQKAIYSIHHEYERNILINLFNNGASLNAFNPYGQKVDLLSLYNYVEIDQMESAQETIFQISIQKLRSQLSHDYPFCFWTWDQFQHSLMDFLGWKMIELQANKKIKTIDLLADFRKWYFSKENKDWKDVIITYFRDYIILQSDAFLKTFSRRELALIVNKAYYDVKNRNTENQYQSKL